MLNAMNHEEQLKWLDAATNSRVKALCDDVVRRRREEDKMINDYLQNPLEQQQRLEQLNHHQLLDRVEKAVAYKWGLSIADLVTILKNTAHNFDSERVLLEGDLVFSTLFRKIADLAFRGEAVKKFPNLAELLSMGKVNSFPYLDLQDVEAGIKHPPISERWGEAQRTKYMAMMNWVLSFLSLTLEMEEFKIAKTSRAFAIDVSAFILLRYVIVLSRGAHGIFQFIKAYKLDGVDIAILRCLINVGRDYMDNELRISWASFLRDSRTANDWEQYIAPELPVGDLEKHVLQLHDLAVQEYQKRGHMILPAPPLQLRKRSWQSALSDDDTPSVMSRGSQQSTLQPLCNTLHAISISDDATLADIYPVILQMQTRAGSIADVYAHIMANGPGDIDGKWEVQFAAARCTNLISSVLLHLNDSDPSTQPSRWSSFWVVSYSDTTQNEWKVIFSNNTRLLCGDIELAVAYFFKVILRSYIRSLPHCESTYLSYSMRTLLMVDSLRNVLPSLDISDPVYKDYFERRSMCKKLHLEEIACLFDNIPIVGRDLEKYLMIPMSTIQYLFDKGVHTLFETNPSLSKFDEDAEVEYVTKKVLCGLLHMILDIRKLMNTEVTRRDDFVDIAKGKCLNLINKIPTEVTASTAAVSENFVGVAQVKRRRTMNPKPKLGFNDFDINAMSRNPSSNDSDRHSSPSIVGDEIALNSSIATIIDDTMESAPVHKDKEDADEMEEKMDMIDSSRKNSVAPEKRNGISSDRPLNDSWEKLKAFRRRNSSLEIHNKPKFAESEYTPIFQRRDSTIEPTQLADISDPNAICPIEDFLPLSNDGDDDDDSISQQIDQITNHFYLPHVERESQWDRSHRHLYNKKSTVYYIRRNYEITKHYFVEELRWTRVFGLLLIHILKADGKGRSELYGVLNRWWNRKRIETMTRSRQLEDDVKHFGIDVIFNATKFRCYSLHFLTSFIQIGWKSKSKNKNKTKDKENDLMVGYWKGTAATCVDDQVLMMQHFRDMELIRRVLSKQLGEPLYLHPKWRENPTLFNELVMEYPGCPMVHAFKGHSADDWKHINSGSRHCSASTPSKIWNKRIENARADKITGIVLPLSEEETEIYKKYKLKNATDPRFSHEEAAFWHTVSILCWNKLRVKDPTDLTYDDFLKILPFDITSVGWSTTLGLPPSSYTERQKLFPKVMWSKAEMKSFNGDLDFKQNNHSVNCIKNFINRLRTTDGQWDRTKISIFWSVQKPDSQMPPSSIVGNHDETDECFKYEESYVLRHLQYPGEPDNAPGCITPFKMRMFAEQYHLVGDVERTRSIVEYMGESWIESNYVPLFQNVESKAEEEFAMTMMNSQHFELLRPVSVMTFEQPSVDSFALIQKQYNAEIAKVILHDWRTYLVMERGAKFLKTSQFGAFYKKYTEAAPDDIDWSDDWWQTQFSLYDGHHRASIDAEYRLSSPDSDSEHALRLKSFLPLESGSLEFQEIASCIISNIPFMNHNTENAIDPKTLSPKTDICPLAFFPMCDTVNDKKPRQLVLVLAYTPLEEEDHSNNSKNTNAPIGVQYDRAIPLFLEFNDALKDSNPGLYRTLHTMILYELFNAPFQFSWSHEVSWTLSKTYEINLCLPLDDEDCHRILSIPHSIVLRSAPAENWPLFRPDAAMYMYDRAIFTTQTQGIHSTGDSNIILNTYWYAFTVGTNLFGSSVANDPHIMSDLMLEIEDGNQAGSDITIGDVIDGAKKMLPKWAQELKPMMKSFVSKGSWVDSDGLSDSYEFDSFLFPDKVDLVSIPTMSNFPGSRMTQRYSVWRMHQLIKKWNADGRQFLCNQKPINDPLFSRLSWESFAASLSICREEGDYSIAPRPYYSSSTNKQQLDEELENSKKPKSTSQSRSTRSNKTKTTKSISGENEEMVNMKIWDVFLVFCARAPNWEMMTAVALAILSWQYAITDFRDLVYLLAFSPHRDHLLQWALQRVLSGNDMRDTARHTIVYVARCISGQLLHFLQMMVNGRAELIITKKDKIIVEEWLIKLGWPVDDIKFELHFKEKRKLGEIADDPSIIKHDAKKQKGSSKKRKFQEQMTPSKRFKKSRPKSGGKRAQKMIEEKESAPQSMKGTRIDSGRDQEQSKRPPTGTPKRSTPKAPSNRFKSSILKSAGRRAQKSKAGKNSPSSSEKRRKIDSEREQEQSKRPPTATPKRSAPKVPSTPKIDTSPTKRFKNSISKSGGVRAQKSNAGKEIAPRSMKGTRNSRDKKKDQSTNSTKPNTGRRKKGNDHEEERGHSREKRNNSEEEKQSNSLLKSATSRRKQMIVSSDDELNDDEKAVDGEIFIDRRRSHWQKMSDDNVPGGASIAKRTKRRRKGKGGRKSLNDDVLSQRHQTSEPSEEDPDKVMERFDSVGKLHYLDIDLIKWVDKTCQATIDEMSTHSIYMKKATTWATTSPYVVYDKASREIRINLVDNSPKKRMTKRERDLATYWNEVHKSRSRHAFLHQMDCFYQFFAKVLLLKCRWDISKDEKKRERYANHLKILNKMKGGIQLNASQ